MNSLAHIREVLTAAHWSFFVLLGVAFGLGICRGHLHGSQRAATPGTDRPDAAIQTALHHDPSSTSRRHHDDPQ